MGMDWRMSSIGTRRAPARGLFAAHVAYVNVKTSDTTSAASIRSVVRSAYSGKAHGLSDSAPDFSVASGAARLRLSSPTMAIAPKTRMAARRSQRPASRPRALIETGGRIFICRPRALLWPQWERLHAHARGIVENRCFVPEKHARCNPAGTPRGIHSYVENLRQLLRNLRARTIAPPSRFGVKRPRRCQRVESRARRATRQASKPSFGQCRQARKGWDAVTVVTIFTTARNGPPHSGMTIRRMG